MSNQYGATPYPPMPGEPYRGPVAGGPAPPSVANAVVLMFIRAGIGLVSIIVVFATKSTLKREILQKNPTADAARLSSLVNAAIAIGVVIGIVFLVFYVFLAVQVRIGHNWARIVTFVLAALGVLGGLVSLAETEPAATHLLAVLTALLDLAIIILLSRRASSQYFKTAPQ